MTLGRGVMLLAGSLILISLVLAWQVNDLWLLLAAFVGLNLFQTSFTGFCPAAMILRKFGLREEGHDFR